MTLEHVLQSRVRPQPLDELSVLILRAECGARLVGALTLAAAASRLPPPIAARCLASLHKGRVTLGTWGPIARAALHCMGSADPLAPWRALLSTGVHRGIDRWVTDYESSLRHSGRVPPRAATVELRDGLASFLAATCDRMASSVGELSLAGFEGATEVVLRDRQIPCAPYLQRTAAAMQLWDSSSKEEGSVRWHWLDYGLLPAAPVEPTSRSGAEMAPSGVQLALQQTSTRDALSMFLGDTLSHEQAPDGSELVVFATHRHDPFEAAEILVDRWRGRSRPVIIVPIEGAVPALERLADVLSSGRSEPRDVFARWLSERPDLERPVVVYVGLPSDLAVLDRVRRALGDLAVIVLVTTADQIHRRWSIVDRRVARLAEFDDPQASLPLAVEARVREQVTPDRAWELAALDVFDAGDEDARALLVRIADGRGELLDSARCVTWWSDGHLSVAADGALRFAHGGWSALVAGILGQARPSAHEAAWEAGRRLAARSRGNDA